MRMLENRTANHLTQPHLHEKASFYIEQARAVCNLLVVRFLERIAGHATYVSESTVYIATGEKVSFR